jgi:hypothetical protein
MRHFTDIAGDRWKVDVTVGSLLDIQSQLGYDLADSIESIPGGLAGQVSLLAVLCSKQIEERGLSERDFAYRLAGESFASAIDCLMRELADFFTHHKPALGAIMTECLNRDSRQMEVTLGAISKALLSPSTSWPESPESTQKT